MSLPRVWSTRRDRISALTLRVRKSGKFYTGGEDAVGLFCQFWANPAVRPVGLQSLRTPHGRATPGNLKRRATSVADWFFRKKSKGEVKNDSAQSRYFVLKFFVGI